MIAPSELDIAKQRLQETEAERRFRLDATKAILPNRTELSRSHLEASKASAAAQVDYLKAAGDFNYRMAEVAKLQAEVVGQHIDNDKQELELRQLQDAVRDYQNARDASIRKLRKAEQEAATVERISGRLVGLLLGDALERKHMPLAWAALDYFLRNVDAQAMAKIGAVSVSASTADDFTNVRDPAVACENPPQADYAMTLLKWARAKQYLPRLGSVPYIGLAQIVVILAEAEARSAAELQTKLSSLSSELEEIRKQGWQKISLARFGAAIT